MQTLDSTGSLLLSNKANNFISNDNTTLTHGAGHNRLPERATDRPRVPRRLVPDIAQHDRRRPRVRIGVVELERHLQRGLVEDAETPAQARRESGIPGAPGP